MLAGPRARPSRIGVPFSVARISPSRIGVPFLWRGSPPGNHSNIGVPFLRRGLPR